MAHVHDSIARHAALIEKAKRAGADFKTSFIVACSTRPVEQLAVEYFALARHLADPRNGESLADTEQLAKAVVMMKAALDYRFGPDWERYTNNKKPNRGT